MGSIRKKALCKVLAVSVHYRRDTTMILQSILVLMQVLQSLQIHIHAKIPVSISESPFIVANL